MEEDKKRRKNKKKKNKQSKTVEDGVTVVEETATGDQNLVNNGKDEQSQLLETPDEQSTNVDSIGHRANGKECAISEEVMKKLRNENDSLIQKEAILEETIRKLKEENDMHFQKEAISEQTFRKLKEEIEMHTKKEATSEETIRKLKEENDMHILKEAVSEETIRKLKEEKYMYFQKEVISDETIRKLKEERDMLVHKGVTLEETINQFRTENELQKQNQADLEMRVAELQSEKNSLLQKEVGLEKKTNELLNEKAVLSLKRESLEERINLLESDLTLFIQKEDSTKETILSLNGDISRLQLQLAELEEYRHSLLLENQQLKENLSSLLATIQNLEKSSSRSLDASAKDCASESEDLKSQVEAARMLVEKLVAENAELVEKVNELYVAPDQQSAVVGLSGSSRPDGMTEFAKPSGVAISMPESIDITSISAQELDSSEEAPVKDNGNTIDAQHAAGVNSNSTLVSDDSGEIVQIPLDDNELRVPEFQAANNAEKDDVPLTDAPLIGAPFRLISFVAKYVSGADLVNKNSSNTNN